ncbi:MAG TPA: hypothetical protein VFZ89_19520, partial [Solirubrobacteraceae bacterium]
MSAAGRLALAAGLAATAAGLAAPAVVPARTITVHAGLPEAATPAFDARRTDVQAFFPQTVSIHVGDIVHFAFAPLRVLRSAGGARPAAAA